MTRLTPLERLTLANQFHLLEILDKQESDYYSCCRKALESGYESEIEDMLERYTDTLSRDECRFVEKTLKLHDALQRSVKALGANTPVPLSDVTYEGFDGNNEGEYTSYSRFLIERRGLWTHVAMRDHNAHMTKIDRYRSMLRKWDALGQSFEMTAEQVEHVFGR